MTRCSATKINQALRGFLTLSSAFAFLALTSFSAFSALGACAAGAFFCFFSVLSSSLRSSFSDSLVGVEAFDEASGDLRLPACGAWEASARSAAVAKLGLEKWCEEETEVFVNAPTSCRGSR